MGKGEETKMTRLNTDFHKNVFINCPFDSEYDSLLRPLLFIVLYLGFIPRIASERFDSLEQRINKIRDLIENSKLSIHDLSRIQASRRNEYYRMNMPFELGVDYGCRLFKEGDTRQKICLVLEKKRFRYKKAFSDLSGVDIKKHDGQPEELVRQTRTWFVENQLVHKAPSATGIWEDFKVFMADFYERREKEGFKAKDLEMMPVAEFIQFTEEWLKKRLGD